MERRVHPRVRLRRKAWIRLSDGRHVSTWTSDISKGGVQLLCKHTADLGDSFELMFNIRDMNGDEHVPVWVRARVAHVVLEAAEGLYRLGFQFEEFLSDNREVLEGYVDYRLRVMFQRGSALG